MDRKKSSDFDSELLGLFHCYIHGRVDTTPRYDEAAAKLSWQRTLEHFNKHLKS
jgi:dienelactone hydrolase